MKGVAIVPDIDLKPEDACSKILSELVSAALPFPFNKISSALLSMFIKSVSSSSFDAEKYFNNLNYDDKMWISNYAGSIKRKIVEFQSGKIDLFGLNKYLNIKLSDNAYKAWIGLLDEFKVAKD